MKELFIRRPPTLAERRAERIEISENELFDIRLEKEACIAMEAKLVSRIERLTLEQNS